MLSDGSLLPSEVAMRYLAAGYKTIAITDHADYSNIDSVIKSILNFTRNWPKNFPITVLAGIELTHLPLKQFKPLAKYGRSEGIEIIVAHGETVVEPVIHGTNRAALESDIDILAHPGLITDEEAKLAKKNGIFLEITSRAGHRDTNRHVAEKALKIGAKLILSTDSHEPEDVIKPIHLNGFAFKAGLDEGEINKIYKNVAEFLSKKEGK
jgi:histidinol phosphatase-like PHP family hydrolase